MNKIDLQTRILNAIRSNDDVRFIFIPSPKLKELVSRGEDDVLSQLPWHIVSAILRCEECKGIILDNSLVSRYIQGRADAKNRYLLSMGDIRVCNMPDLRWQSPEAQ